MKTRRTFPALALSVLLGLGAVPVSYTVAPVPSACAAVQTAAEWYQRGSEAQDAEQYEEAVQDYTEAIRLEPSNAKAYAGRGYMQTLRRMRSGQTSSPREVRMLFLSSCGSMGINEARKKSRCTKQRLFCVWRTVLDFGRVMLWELGNELWKLFA